MKRKLITFNVDNHIDLITNSSSELFVLKGETKKVVEEMIASVYPEYRGEYDEVKSIEELTIDELDTFFDYHCLAHCWPASKKQYPLLPGFTFDELYEAEESKPAWNGEIQYRLKNNVKNPEHKWHRSFVTEENKNELVARLGTNTYFLYSLDENPNWEM